MDQHTNVIDLCERRDIARTNAAIAAVDDNIDVVWLRDATVPDGENCDIDADAYRPTFSVYGIADLYDCEHSLRWRDGEDDPRWGQYVDKVAARLYALACYGELVALDDGDIDADRRSYCLPEDEEWARGKALLA